MTQTLERDRSDAVNVAYSFDPYEGSPSSQLLNSDEVIKAGLERAKLTGVGKVTGIDVVFVPSTSTVEVASASNARKNLVKRGDDWYGKDRSHHSPSKDRK